MADTERPNFIKPEDSSSTLVGYPRPGGPDAALDDRVQKAQIDGINNLIENGRLRLEDVRDMLLNQVRRRNKRHEDPTGLGNKSD